MGTFDLQAFTRAAEALDAEAWLAWYAPEAPSWWEYRHAQPGARNPHVMTGVGEIGEHLRGVSAPLTISVDSVVPGENRSAFTLTVTFPDGSRIIENVIIEHPDGRHHPADRRRGLGLNGRPRCRRPHPRVWGTR